MLWSRGAGLQSADTDPAVAALRCDRPTCDPFGYLATGSPHFASPPPMTGPAGGVIMSGVAQQLTERAESSALITTFLPPPTPTIVPATDLGGVGVLKHGNLYLLSDAFGDIHPDSRGLGLYDLDTRVLSCAVLRVNGVRPTLLAGQVASNHISSIQLANPELRRDPTMKQPDEEGLSRRALAISRRRWIAGGLAERIEVTNYSGRPQEVDLDLEVDVDDADIFEVRGYPRKGRGTFSPTEATDRSLLFS